MGLGLCVMGEVGGPGPCAPNPPRPPENFLLSTNFKISQDLRMPQFPMVQDPSQVMEAYVLWDEKNPRSLFNKINFDIGERFKDFAEKYPDWFSADEKSLYAMLKAAGKTPTPMDNRLRLKFWVEYESVMGSARDSCINFANVHSGICCHEVFYRNYLTQPSKVAWLLCMPTNYFVKIEEALEFGIEQLREILELPNILENGKLNTVLIKHKIMITQMLDLRVHGGITQRIEQKSMNVHLTGKEMQRVNKLAQSLTEEEMIKRLTNLEREERKLLHLPDQEEVSVEVDSGAESPDE